MSIFCELCTPLVGQHVDSAVAKAQKDYETKLAGFGEMKSKLEGLELAAADATKRADSAEETLKTQADAKATDEKNFLALAEAVKPAQEAFEKRKDQYPEDKREEVARILLKLQLGQSTPEDALNLADWKISKADTDTSVLMLAGSTSTEKPKLTPDQLDEMLGLKGLHGHKEVK